MMRFRAALVLSWVALTLSAGTVPASAQGDASVAVRLRDSNLKPIGNVEVGCRKNGILVAQGKTDSQGNLVLACKYNANDTEILVSELLVKTIDPYHSLAGGSGIVVTAVRGQAPPPAQRFKDPIWNVWQEDYTGTDPSYSPAKMTSGRKYVVVVNLSAMAYNSFAAGVYSQDASEEFNKWGRDQGDTAAVQVLAVPDERYFERLDDNQRVQPLPIDVAKLRKMRKEGFTLDGSPFAYLAKNGGKADFSFGKAQFELTVKENVSGLGSIAFSVWADGKPVDEIAYSTCIVNKEGEQCPAAAIPQNSLRGVDVRNYNKQPDAAIHLIELNSSNLVGVFRCNTCGWSKNDFRVWKLGRGAEWFHEQFTRTVLPGINLAANGPDPKFLNYNENTFGNAGDALYSLIFNGEGANPIAETAVREFVSTRIGGEQPGDVPPSIFVRLLPKQPDKVFLIPLGLARVTIGQGRQEFLGFHFRIQTPLELQDYSQPENCIKKWVLLVPPTNLGPGNPLATAQAYFNDWITTFSNWKPSATTYYNVDDFKDWLRGGASESDAIVILSHHANNSLFIDPQKTAMFATNVLREFNVPSLAIIDGCGTANPGAFEFVREFNRHHINAVVTSSVDINASMGGKFLAILVQKLYDSRADSNYSLDRAVIDAIRELSKEKDGANTLALPYGPRALLFGLAGNGSLRLCLPDK